MQPKPCGGTKRVGVQHAKLGGVMIEHQKPCRLVAVEQLRPTYSTRDEKVAARNRLAGFLGSSELIGEHRGEVTVKAPVIIAQADGEGSYTLADYFRDTREPSKWKPWRLFSHVPPTQQFDGLFNWHLHKGWFRLIFRPRRKWHLYMRLCWSPRCKFEWEIERKVDAA